MVVPSVSESKKNEHKYHRLIKDVNTLVLECYLSVDENGDQIREYQHIYDQWRENVLFKRTDQRLCDQTRSIRKHRWSTKRKLEVIKRRIQENSSSRGND